MSTKILLVDMEKFRMSINCCLVTKSRLTCSPKDCILPSSSVDGISQAGNLEWAVVSF